MAYFEFLPLNKIDANADSISATEQEHLVEFVDVELGQEYELVVTTYAGKISIIFNLNLNMHLIPIIFGVFILVLAYFVVITGNGKLWIKMPFPTISIVLASFYRTRCTNGFSSLKLLFF